MPLLTITNLTNRRLATRGSFGSVGPEERRAKSLTVAQIEQLRPFLIDMERAGVITWDVGGYSQTDEDAEFITAEDAGPSGPGGPIEIFDEGVSLGQFSLINFVGADVEARSPSSSVPGAVDVFIPPPAFLSHWNTSDGSNGAQLVTETTTRVQARISNPSGGQGFPFNTNGWEGTNQDATLDTSLFFTTPGPTTGFGGDSTVTVRVFDADGSTVLDTFTTPFITGNATYISPTGFLSVAITGFGPDSVRFQAQLNVNIQAGPLLAFNGLQGGRFHVEIQHTADSVSDGTGSYLYVQPDVFLDTNPTTPALSGSTGIAETVGLVLTKHLSGLEYYILGSQFTVTLTDMDDLNENTQRIPHNVEIRGTEYGLPNLDQAPYPGGAGNANFSNWTNDHDQDDVDYQFTAWAITTSNYRYIGPTANITGQPRDPWGIGSSISSPDSSVLIDTFGITSSDLSEDFDDESRRQDSGYNGGTSVGNWVSTNSLAAGEAQVFNSRLLVPSTTTLVRSDGPNSANANWTGYLPVLGGPNPDYSTLIAPVSYYRTIVDGSFLNRASFQIVFSGSFVADATTDLANGDLQIFVRRRASVNGGDTGPAANPLLLHGALYNFATFDDGVTDGQIREASSIGNVVNGTFGGFTCETGFFIEITIVNSVISIDSFAVTFF